MEGRRGRGKAWAVGLTGIALVVLLGAILVRGLGATAEKAKGPEPPVRPVKTMVLSETKLPETRSFPGLVRAAAETDLAFRVGGPLIEFNVRSGRKVAKGEVVARIDPRDFEINVLRLRAALEEAKAALRAMRAGARAEDIAALKSRLGAARARMAEARKNFERLERLLADRAVSQAQYDQAQAAYDTAAAEVDILVQDLHKARRGARAEDIEAAQAGLDRLSADLKAAKNALGDTRLRAPFSGVVNRKHVENHESVRAGDSILSLLDVSTVDVHAVIPEDLVIRRDAFSRISCTLDVYPERRFEATLKEVGRKTDSANQSYPMTVTLSVPDDIAVEPGMAATLSISLERPGGHDRGFLVPLGALSADAEGNSCVWRVDPQTLRVSRTRITTGRLGGDSVEVLSGLMAGDRVVTAGARFLRDDQQVRILDDGPGGRT